MEAMQKIKCLTIEDSNFPDRLRKTFRNAKKKLYYIGKPAKNPKKACCSSGRCPACAVLWQMSGI